MWTPIEGLSVAPLGRQETASASLSLSPGSKSGRIFWSCAPRCALDTATMLKISNWHAGLAKPNRPTGSLVPYGRSVPQHGRRRTAPGVAKQHDLARGGSERPRTIFGIQLALSVAWSWMRFPDCIVPALPLWRLSRRGGHCCHDGHLLAMLLWPGLLLVPYLAWASFASASKLRRLAIERANSSIALRPLPNRTGQDQPTNR